MIMKSNVSCVSTQSIQFGDLDELQGRADARLATLRAQGVETARLDGTGRERRCRGSYILSPFSAAAGATAAVELLGWFPRLKRLGGVVAALFGGPMATYTAVLLANTAVPSWHEPHNELPFVFAGSAMAAGGGLTMVFTPVDEEGPSRKMGVTGAAIELAAIHKVERGQGIVSEPYHLGRAGTPMKAAKTCTPPARD